MRRAAYQNYIKKQDQGQEIPRNTTKTNQDYRVTYSGSSPFETFVNVVRDRMRGREYGFKEIWLLLQDSQGSSISKATAYRIVSRAVRSDLLYKRNLGNKVVYGVSNGRESDVRVAVLQNHLGMRISEGGIDVANLIVLRNPTKEILHNVFVPLPYGPVSNIRNLGLSATDSLGSIKVNNFVIGYTFQGQTGLSIGLNEPLGFSDYGYLLLRYRIPLSEGNIKIGTFYDIGVLYINVVTLIKAGLNAKKWMLDGVKFIEPNGKRSQILSTELKATKFEFTEVRKGETVEITWHE